MARYVSRNGCTAAAWESVEETRLPEMKEVTIQMAAVRNMRHNPNVFLFARSFEAPVVKLENNSI